MSSSPAKDTKDPIFKDLNADAEPEITEIESLCLRCQNNGMTRLLLTKIPFYKEVVIMSFTCDHCHWENNELKPASIIQEKGVSYKLNARSIRDLSRIVVKTEWASVMIPEFDFEIPAQSQEGTVTTIEGIIDRTCSGLNSKLNYLKIEDSESASKLSEFVEELTKLKTGDVPFTFIVRDCSGNSFLENLCAPKQDPQLEVTHFERNREESLMLGLYSEDFEPEEKCSGSDDDASDLKDEVLGLPTNCYSCNAPCVTNMKLTQIPHFKDVVIMATTCDACGHKTNEVKSNTGIEPLGVRITLSIQTPEDLSRDVLKSDTCSICIRELELEAGSAVFGGRYSTVEGILTTIKDELKKNNPFLCGDSADALLKEKMEQLFNKIDEIISGSRKATLIFDDPCGNSYLQSLGDSDENLVIEKYQRTLEQDEELGILDMKVENYEET
ncbi:zinc finger protein ZPR1-like [Uloborus diversus]|uniref:zinc finger protein ZPR1-like n=1 Tax=Uloborus diversus TaxID=327109 RepID=UPI0024092862|nr:zinc finger protein ZPR1-like [Uloborus diversus]